MSTGCSHAEVAAFIEQFEAQRLPKAQWTHAGHLVAGFWYVRRLGADRALAELRTGIRCHNESVGTANTDSSGYHETITRLYVEAIAAYLHRMPAQSFEDALRGLLASPLSSSDWPLLFYTKARLFSAQARRQWLAPDLTDQEQGA